MSPRLARQIVWWNLQILSPLRNRTNPYRVNLRFPNLNLFSKRYHWINNCSNNLIHKTSWHLSLARTPTFKSISISKKVLSMTTNLSNHKTLMTNTTSTLTKTMMQSACKLRKMFWTTTLNVWNKKLIWSLLKAKLSQNWKTPCSTTRTTIWIATCSQLKRSQRRNSKCTQSC